MQFHNGITGFAIFETCAILGVRIFVKFYGFNSFLTGWRNGEDELCWKLDKSRGFEMGGYYISLVSTTAVSFPWKVPPRLLSFLELLLWVGFSPWIIYRKEKLL